MKICDRANRRCESLSLSLSTLPSSLLLLLPFSKRHRIKKKEKEKRRKESRFVRREISREIAFSTKTREYYQVVIYRMEENGDFGNRERDSPVSRRWRGMGWVSLAFLSSGLALAFPIAISIILGGVPSQHSLSYNVIIFSGEGKAYAQLDRILQNGRPR